MFLIIRLKIDICIITQPDQTYHLGMYRSYLLLSNQY